MSAGKGSNKMQRREVDGLKSEKRKREDPGSLDADLSAEIKGIMSALNHIKEKAQKDGQKKNEETVSRISSEITSMFDELKTKFEKDRMAFAKILAKSTKECENALKEETLKFQEIHEKFGKEKAAHLKALKDAMAKFEEDKDKLMKKYEQQRKKDRNMLQEHEKSSAEKIAALEQSLKKTKTKEANPFNLLRKMVMEDASDEEILADD